MPVSFFTLTCPRPENLDPHVAAIRARGNVPLMISDLMLAEIDRVDLIESWDSAAAIAPDELLRMSKLACARLAEALDDSLGTADLIELVTDAAVLFLVSMRNHGARSPDDIKPCTLLWDAACGQDELMMRA